MAWIILNSIKQIRVAGVSVVYHPGDAVEVGKQTAIEWILEGSAEDPFGQVGPSAVPAKPGDTEFGIHVRAPESSVNATVLGEISLRVPISYGPVAAPYLNTFLWEPSKVVSPRLLNYGFLRTVSGKWDLASSLFSYKALADQVGSEEDREGTKALIGDIRLPVYDSRLVWVRQTAASRAFLETWHKELEKGTGEFHSFLRALYTARPMICTLPMDWTR